MYKIITEPTKEWLIDKPYWNNYDLAYAYCQRFNRAFPNIFFGVKYVEKVDLESMS
jgi:hypothetical protein